MTPRKKVTSEYFDIVDPIADQLDDITKQTKRVVETGVDIQQNFRYLAIGLRGITRRTSMKVLSSVLSFATPVDIENVVEDVTSSAITVYRFVKNSGLLPLYASRFRYFKYEEQDLSEFLDDIEGARDMIADMEFDRIDMTYSIDVVRGAESLINAMSGLKSKSISGAKTLAKTGLKFKGITDKIPGVMEKEATSAKLEKQQAEQATATTETMKERLTSIKNDWPQFQSAVDNLCIRLKPILSQLNEVLGVQTSKGKRRAPSAKFEVYSDKSKQFRFRLRAANNEIIAVSEAYTTKKACMNGIESIKNNALLAETDDQTK